jgi:hypothetical protein
MTRVDDWRGARPVEDPDRCDVPVTCLPSPATAPIYQQYLARRPERLSREQRAQEAVVLSFSGALPKDIEPLPHLSHAEWKRLLGWLDVNGLALYLLDRLTQLSPCDTLPQARINELQQRMNDNTQRTRGMVKESVVIQLEFQRAGLHYAVMKGISLSPLSVPRPELRHQFDLDYLIAEESAPEARRILELRGYRLFAVSGNTWEFKINETPNVSIRDLYKDLPYRGVELHVETDTPGQASRLSRIQHRKISGIIMPIFSPVDLFLGQALHAFKDVCSAFSRTSHLLEFYRHVLARCGDDLFWNEPRATAEDDRRTCIAIGVVTCLISSIMGNFAPGALTVWTVDVLPPSVRLWADRYGRQAVFGKHPGTKLYLLLQRELGAANVRGERTMEMSILRGRLPPPVVRASTNETFPNRIARYRIQVWFILARLRFHIVEGCRCWIESYRWQRHLDRLSR